MKTRKIKVNVFSVLATVLFIAALILLNVLVGMLTERFFLKADLTDTGIYTLSDRAAEYLGTVSEPVDIVVLSEESAWLANQTYSRAVNILQNYSAQTGGRIRVQYVNPDLNTFNGPDYNNTLSVLRDSHTELEGMERNDIIFLSSRRATKIRATELFTQEFNQAAYRYVTSGVNADQALVSSLMYVLNESVARVVFITNHQENQGAILKNIFELSGYVSLDINLATEDIPDDTLIVISSGPKGDFLDNEIEKLERFLIGGGNAMILYEFGIESLPVLDSFLEQWGIIVDNRVIFDEDYTYIPQLGVIGAHIVAGSLPFANNAETITKTEVPIGVYLPRPLRAAWAGESNGGMTMRPMMQTFSTSSYAKELSTGSTSTFERESGDESGPFVLAYNTRMLTRNAEGNQVNANLIVTGANMFEDDFMNYYGNSFYNVMFIAGIANDLNPFGEGIYIPAKKLTDSSMPVSSGGARSVLVIMVIGLPLAIAASGIVVWRKRRNL